MATEPSLSPAWTFNRYATDMCKVHSARAQRDANAAVKALNDIHEACRELGLADIPESMDAAARAVIGQRRARCAAFDRVLRDIMCAEARGEKYTQMTPEQCARYAVMQEHEHRLETLHPLKPHCIRHSGPSLEDMALLNKEIYEQRPLAAHRNAMKAYVSEAIYPWYELAFQ